MKNTNLHNFPTFNADVTVYDYSKAWAEEDSNNFISTKRKQKVLRLIIDDKTIVDCQFYGGRYCQSIITYSKDYNVNSSYVSWTMESDGFNFEIHKKLGFKYNQHPKATHSFIVAMITVFKELIQGVHNLSEDYTKYYVKTAETEDVVNYIMDKCIYELDSNEADTAWFTLGNAMCNVGLPISMKQFNRFISHFGNSVKMTTIFGGECLLTYAVNIPGAPQLISNRRHEPTIFWRFVTNYTHYKDEIPNSIINPAVEYYWNNR